MLTGQLIDAVFNAFHDHIAKVVVGLLIAAIGWGLGYRRARVNWKKREFLDRLNVSLNIVSGGVLKIRTLSEKRCDDVFLNSVAARTVMGYARQTTKQDPLLNIPKDDYWHYLNAVLNDLSEQFAYGTMKLSIGADYSRALYVVCLTSEVAGAARTRKVRAMVVSKALMQQIPVMDDPQFEQPYHSVRWETLRTMAAQYRDQPWRFIEVELCV